MKMYFCMIIISFGNIVVIYSQKVILALYISFFLSFTNGISPLNLQKIFFFVLNRILDFIC